LACFFFLNRKLSEIVQEGVAERAFTAFGRFENNHLAMRGREEKVFFDPDFSPLAVVVSLEVGAHLGHGGIDVILGAVVNHLEIGIAVAFHHKEELRKLGSQAVTNLFKELFSAGRSREILRLHHVPSAPTEEGQDRKCQDKKLGSCHSNVTLPCPGKNCKITRTAGKSYDQFQKYQTSSPMHIIPKRTGKTDLDGRSEAFKGKTIDEEGNLNVPGKIFINAMLDAAKEEACFVGLECFVNPLRNETVSFHKEPGSERTGLLKGLFFLFRIAHPRKFFHEAVFLNEKLGVFRPFEMSSLFNEFENDLVIFTSKP